MKDRLHQIHLPCFKSCFFIRHLLRFFFCFTFFMKLFLHCFFFPCIHTVSFLFTMESSFYLSYQGFATTTISLLYMLLFLFNPNSPVFLLSSSSFHPFFLTNFFFSIVCFFKHFLPSF